MQTTNRGAPFQFHTPTQNTVNQNQQPIFPAVNNGNTGMPPIQQTNWGAPFQFHPPAQNTVNQNHQPTFPAVNMQQNNPPAVQQNQPPPVAPQAPILQNLNPQQQQVVNDSTSRAIFVSASPGTGKTHLCAAKVTKCFQDGMIPNNLGYLNVNFSDQTGTRQQAVNIPLLVISFSKKVKEELIERLSQINPGVAPFVHTFHSFARKILTGNGQQLPRKFSKDDFKWEEDLQRYIPDAVDFMKYESTKINVGVLIVDEMQDLSENQLKLLQQLTVVHQAMAVGDPKQCIYEWRDASLNHIDTFKESFNAQTYELTQNYRSNQDIVSLANKFIHSNMFSNNVPAPNHHSIVMKQFDDAQKCYCYIQFRVSQQLQKGKTVALLAHTNKVLNQFKYWFQDVNQKPSLLTTHAAKGLEYDVVYLLGVNDREYPFHPRENDSDEKKRQKAREEERIFYVGLTRAKQQLYICCWKQWDAHSPRSPSPYLRRLVQQPNTIPIRIDAELRRKLGVM